jgi:hypothetical protein
MESEGSPPADTTVFQMGKANFSAHGNLCLLMAIIDAYFAPIPFENQFVGVTMFLVMVLHLFGHVA